MKIVRIKHENDIRWAYLEDDSNLLLLDDAPWMGGQVTGENLLYKNSQLLSPCVPEKIIAVAVNYPGATGFDDKAEEPLVFIKTNNCIIGPHETVLNPFKDSAPWGECELALVIGKTLRKASVIEAKEAIFGYCIANDVTIENLYNRDHHLARSKAADTFCPVGPWIDTDYKPGEQLIQGWHNKTLLREGRLSDRIYKEPELLVWLSSWICLEPGDLVLTGAPTRVRDRIYYSEGDTFTCVVEGLGRITNSYSEVIQS